MYDIIGKVWAFLFGIMLLFVGSVTLYAEKQDVAVQNYVNAAVTEFVDVSRASGEITDEQYRTFIGKLDATGNLYDVKMIHYREKTTAAADYSDNYQTYYESYNEKEILDSMDRNDGKYQLHNGDFLRVEVKNFHPTLGRKLMGFFLMRPTTDGGQIFANYGGYIGND